MRVAMMNSPRISVNARAATLIERLRADPAEFRVAIDKGELGETRIDAGSRCQGSIAAGLSLTQICMGGLGTVEITPSAATPNWPWTLVVCSSHPVTACLASQYAGWKLSHGTGKDAFFALGSGPARALARKEPLFSEIAYRDEAETAALVLESSRPPPAAIVSKVAQDCGLAPDRLTFLYAPTQSLAGSVQVVARVLEVALHKTHELKFPLDRLVEGMGAAPLSPPHPDFVVAMGRTNDAIIYGGRVHLFVNGPASDAQALAEQLPSRRSRDYGRPFAEIFASFHRDFYAIDPMLFAPAAVIVTALETGDSFHAGGLDQGLLDAAFR
jgi:methenyltetrahydromethanopterin cyclohydrolase